MTEKYNYGSERSDYLTPPKIIDYVLGMFGRKEFDLDTCCSERNIPALCYYIHSKHDGLTSPWGRFNWCNPPYSECIKWVRKAEQERLKGNTTVMLIPARTETGYWQDCILKYGCAIKKGVCVEFLKKGHRFLDSHTHLPMGVFKNALALVYFLGDYKGEIYGK